MARTRVAPPPSSTLADIALERMNRAELLVHEMARLEVLAEQSVALNQPAAAVAARKAVVELHAEYVQLLAARRRKRAPASAQDHAAELARDTRQLRQDAEAARSFVAAARLLELERTQLLERIAAEQHRADAELEAQSEAEIIAGLVQALRELPDQLRERVRAAAFAPLH